MFRRIGELARKSYSLNPGYTGLSTSMAELYGPSIKVRNFSVKSRSNSNFRKVSTIVGIGGTSLKAALLTALEQKKLSKKQNIYVFGQASWVSLIHQDWFDKPWGQSKRVMPVMMRQIIDDLYPSLPDTQLLCFGMMKEVIDVLEQRVKDAGIIVINQDLKGFRETEEGLIAVRQNEEEIYLGDSDYRILNSASIPGGYLNIPVNACGKLYQYSKKESTSEIAIIGSGANLVWCCRDFGFIRPIIHIVPPNDRPMDHLDRFIASKIVVDDAFEFRVENNSINFVGTSTQNTQIINSKVDKEDVYSALGNSPDLKVVSAINPQKVSNINFGEKITEFRTRISSGLVEMAVADMRGTALPPGNMLSNYFEILKEFNSFSPGMENAVVVFETWKKAIIEIAVTQEIVIGEEFFEALKPLIRESYLNGIPPERTVNYVIKSQYSKSDFPAKRADGTILTTDEFMNLINWSDSCPEEENRNQLGS